MPWFTACNAFWFNAFDPPRTLRPVANLDPPVTTEDPKVSSQTPMPSITQDPGPTKTPSTSDAGTSAILQPANSQPVSQPKQTAGHGQDPAASVDQPQPTIAVPGGDPDTISAKIDPSVQQPADTTPASQPKQTAVISNGDPTGNEDPGRNGDTSDSGASTSNDGSGNNGDSTGNGDPAGSGQSTDNGGPTIDGVLSGNGGSSGDGESSTGTQDPQRHGSQASKSYELQAGEVSRTIIQLGSHPSPKVTTIHLGNNGNEQHRTQTPDPKTPDPIASFVIAPFDPINNPKHHSIPNSLNGASSTTHPVVTAAGQKLTISDASAVSIMGTVITPGGTGVDIEGTSVSLGQSGNLVVGDIGSSSGRSVLTIAGNTMTANPTSFEIAGTPVTAGGPRVTFSGVAVSLGSSGNLVVEGNARATAGSLFVFTSDGLAFTSEVTVGGATAAVARPSSLFTVGSVTFTANPTAFAVGTSTLSAGGPGMTVASTPISLDPQGSLVVGSTTVPLQSPTPSLLTTDGQTVTFEANSRVVFGGVTLSPGGQGATVSGAPVSVGVFGLVMGSDTIALQAPTPTVVTTDGVIFTLQQQSQIAIDGTILSIGGQGITMSGKPISIGSSGLVIGSNTIPLQAPTATLITTDGVTLTLRQQQVAIDGTTLSIGGPGITVSGTPISIASNGLLIGSDTINIQSPAPTIITTDNQVLTLEQSGRVALGGITLSAGGPAATVGGASISVGPSDLVIGTNNIPLPSRAGHLGNGTSVSGVDTFTSVASSLKATFWMVWWGVLVLLAIVL